MSLPQYEKRNSNNWLLSSWLIGFYFEFLMYSLVFHFHKKKWKTKNSSFFVFHFMKKLKKEWLKKIRLTLWLFSQVWSTCYSQASSCQVPCDFPLCNCHADIKDPLCRKQLICFNVYIAGFYFRIYFILIENYDVAKTCRSSHREVFA